MITFKELLQKLDIDDENLYKKNIKIEKILLDKKNLEIFINFSSYEELDDELKKIIEDKITNQLNKLKIIYKYNILSKEYTDEISLIKDEIINYNPSAKVWIDNLKIHVKKEESCINIEVFDKNIYYLITKNELKNILEDKLKIFGEYKLNFIETELEIDTSEDKIEEIITSMQKQEKIISQKIDLQRTSNPTETQKMSSNDKYSYGKKDISSVTKLIFLNSYFKKVTVEVDVFSIDVRETKNNKFLISLSITDYTSSYIAKIFLTKDKIDEFLSKINIGSHVLITGDIQYDSYSKSENIFIKYIEVLEKHIKQDTNNEKRVELKLHSKMSAMNGVSSFNEFAKRASDWGMSSIAITDISDVQGFPEAMECGKKYGLKVIYGLDCNFVDNCEDIVKNYNGATFTNSFVVFDIETTGFSPQVDEITEIGAVKIVDGVIVDRFSQLVNPMIKIPDRVVELTGISNDFVKDEPTIDKVIVDFNDFCKNSVLVAHNAGFDISFIRRDMLKYNLSFNFTVLDTLSLARAIIKDIKRFNLTALSKKLGVSLVNAHRAVNDAEATAEVFIKMLDILKKLGIKTFCDINKLKKDIDSSILFESSISLLVKNNVGLKNLYKLVSESHMNYVNRVAKVPRSLINKYREGILVGSGNSSSELFKAVFNMESEENIRNIARYYDYIEIQPLENNLNYIENNLVKDYDTLKFINKKLYDLGKELNIPVVATGDVYYLDEKDDITRRVILNGQTGRPPENAHIPQKLFFRTTDEMLEEFSYLGKDQSYEVVVKNTNMIANLCEDIKPIPDGTYPPIIEGADSDLRKICYEKAHEIYGDNLPEIVENRLDRELNSIISNGYAVLYIIAQKLVKKSNDDGYLVGSRGSVGSSFAATMSSITEVNPLPPHYICPNCKYFEDMSNGTVDSGIDLPDKICPVCGSELKKDGHDIPFEVFLGFNGDKEPDIDLNFAGEYQPTAHKYTEELFGEGYVFRAGTIGTVAEKTAYGYVKKFYEDKNISNVEIDRIAKAAIGVKRTSGQHPGGVMICPKSKEIFDFTPIQYPADDKSSGVITTHFDYNFIHGKILKLDILGHDGPTIIKMLEDFTGLNSQKIPLDDEKTISLFSCSDELKLNENIFSSSTGTLGIPEFGTNFVKQMLIETHPKNFAELVRISGLSHGTNVWTNNAQELVKAGKAKLSDVICTREDIMLYLIRAGAENKMAFDTMEKVRKGKGLSDEQKKIMNTLPLPNWYIDSCEKIEYMFPKAHAVAYVMLSFRIAYYKLNYPLAYYATYFTIKLADFNGELIMKGVNAIKERINDLNNSNDKLSAKEKGELTVLEVVLEMFARGFEFAPVDIYKSNASKFDIYDNKVLMPLRAFFGVGETVADNIVSEREKGEFISIEDIIKRTKATKSVIDILNSNNLLKEFPQTNQLSLFNLF
ncbi:DNA polymerase III, alpha subunit, Gram-positive type [Peptoniphilus sp. oral taxon 386 str. F0131]|nr:DNA polymerase III, alpha subunit, Gram-positive type [Peptoniphilus sp. oral taxon 386 str. F0131]